MGPRRSYAAGRKMKEGGRCRREEDHFAALGRSCLLFPTALAPRSPRAADTGAAGVACRDGEVGVKARKKVSFWIW